MEGKGEREIKREIQKEGREEDVKEVRGVSWLGRKDLRKEAGSVWEKGGTVVT